MSPRYPKQFNNREELLNWYKEHKWFHGRLAQLVSHFLQWRVEVYFAGIRLPVLAKISEREKRIESVMANLERGAYGSFPIAREKLSDLAGVRVVFYFRDDVQHFVDQRAQLFRAWFGIYADEHQEYNDGLDAQNWRGTSPDYRSWHFVIRVDDHNDFYNALNYSDRAFLKGLFCEVQLRTTLQDAWAESNHDIRYKLAQDSSTRRDLVATDIFHRLSDQLRSADDTLVQLKRDYQFNVEERSGDGKLIHEHSWSPPTFHFGKGARVNGVAYDYEVLDWMSSEEPFSIVSSTTVFDIDQVMWERENISGYKDMMWRQLQNSEAQFVNSITYDSMVVRATAWDPLERKLSVELAAYSDQVVTNHKRAHNKYLGENPGGKRVKDLAVDEAGELLPFEKSPLSNTVGVSCVIRTADAHWVISLRSTSVAFDPGTWGCTASGALNWVELGHWRHRDFRGWFQNGIVREVEEELGYTTDPEEVTYLAFAREFGRLGKPQVFFYIKADLSCDQLTGKFKAYKKPDSEFQTLAFLDESKATDLVSADRDKVNAVCRGANVSEELRFNLALALAANDLE